VSHHVKFRQNQSNACEDIAIFDFEDNGRPQYLIFKFFFGKTGMEGQCASLC